MMEKTLCEDGGNVVIAWSLVWCFKKSGCDSPKLRIGWADGAAWTTAGQMKIATTDEPDRFLGV
jgi:hypothetical protein